MGATEALDSPRELLPRIETACREQHPSGDLLRTRRRSIRTCGRVPDRSRDRGAPIDRGLQIVPAGGPRKIIDLYPGQPVCSRWLHGGWQDSAVTAHRGPTSGPCHRSREIRRASIFCTGRHRIEADQSKALREPTGGCARWAGSRVTLDPHRGRESQGRGSANS